MFWFSVAINFPMVGIKKTVLHKKKWCWVGLFPKVVREIWFSGKSIFLESVSFHLEIFYVNKFRLVLGICYVHVRIFINKYLVNLFRMNFCDLLNILIMIVLIMIEKWCLVFFSEVIKRLWNIKKQKKTRLAYEKTFNVVFLDFWSLKLCSSLLK